MAGARRRQTGCASITISAVSVGIMSVIRKPRGGEQPIVFVAPAHAANQCTPAYGPSLASEASSTSARSTS